MSHKRSFSSFVLGHQSLFIYIAALFQSAGEGYQKDIEVKQKVMADKWKVRENLGASNILECQEWEEKRSNHQENKHSEKRNSSLLLALLLLGVEVALK